MEEFDLTDCFICISHVLSALPAWISLHCFICYLAKPYKNFSSSHSCHFQNHFFPSNLLNLLSESLATSTGFINKVLLFA
jgi:hypothetical protein